MIVLPNSEDSEKALLWCMLIDNYIISKIKLKEEDFYNNLYFRLFNSIKAIYELKWKVDILQIKDFLEKKNVLESIWWMTFIVELIEDTPSSANWKIYFDLVKEKSNRRKVINIWRKIEQIGFKTEDDSEHILTKVKNLSENIFEIEDSKWFNNIDLADKFYDLQERFKKYKWLWYNSCYPLLDKYTWWIIPWTVQTIVAYSNVWKSSFAYSYIPKLLKDNKKVLFLSNEVMADVLYWNILKTYYKKNLKEVMSEDFYKYFDWDDFKNLVIQDNIYTLDDIKIVIENSDSDVVFIDFIQNINTGLKTEYESMSKVAIELQRLAIKTWKTIFSISQANNESRFKWGDKIQPKGSWAIFASSDIIIALTNDWIMKLNILKNKYWKKDITYLVNAEFETLQFKLWEDTTNLNE